MIAPAARPIPAPTYRPRWPPCQPSRRYCTVATDGVTAFCSAKGDDIGAATAGAASHGAEAATSATARILYGTVMTNSPNGLQATPLRPAQRVWIGTIPRHRGRSDVLAYLM